LGKTVPGLSLAGTVANTLVGPGEEFDEQVQAAFLLVQVMRKIKKDDPVDIFSYSRGAIAAVYLARKLAEEDPPIPVRFMGLLDPSTTYSQHDAPTIPSNVQAAKVVYADGKARTGVMKVITDNLMVTHDILPADNPKVVQTRHDPSVGHSTVRNDIAAGVWFWPDNPLGLPLPTDPKEIRAILGEGQ
jgi:hypothetical protein